MIKNTDLFYNRAREYQNKRKVIMDCFEKRVKSLEDTRGSKYFDDEMKKATDARDGALSALKVEYAEYFRISLDAMSKGNASRKMTPPTEEELRTLQLLKMKDKPTETELQAAANTLKGNTTCLSVLTEIAHNAVRDFMDYDMPRAARTAQNYHETVYGTIPDAPALNKRPLFDDKAGCFYEVYRLSGDALTAFCTAVDGQIMLKRYSNL